MSSSSPPPPSASAIAEQAIAAFERSPLPGVWQHLDKATLVAELRQRVADPFKLTQGRQPFCGPAAIAFELIRRQPQRYVEVCRSLYEQGFVQGRTKRIEALLKLRQASKGELRMGQVDWMLLATLRDAESLIFSVDPEAPSFVRNLSGMSFSWEIRGWVQEILGYPQIIHTKTYKKGDLLALRDAANSIKLGGVALPLVTAQGLLGTATHTEPGLPINLPNHWVSLLGNVSLQGGRVAFDVYTWGRRMRVDVTEPTFQKNFWGVVIGLP